MHGTRLFRGPHCTSSCLLRAHSSTMKGSQAIGGPPGLPEGSLEGLDLSLTGLPPPVSRRPNSASAAKPVFRSISVVTGSEPKRKALVSARAGAPGGLLTSVTPSSPVAFWRAGRTRELTCRGQGQLARGRA